MPTSYRQVVMVGCLDSYESPRVRVPDDAAGVAVAGLGVGDEVQMLDLETNLSTMLVAGLSPLPIPAPRFLQFKKTSGTSPKPTSIEIHRGR